MRVDKDLRTGWTRFFVPDPSFGWYVRGVTTGVVTGIVVFGGLLWHFHRSLGDRLGLAEAGADPALQELLLEYSSLTLLATGVTALGGALFVVMMCLYLLHRIAGPVYRLKLHMQEIIDGGPVRELRFRQEDQHRDLADTFNELMRQLGRLEDRDAAQPPGTGPASAHTSTPHYLK